MKKELNQNGAMVKFISYSGRYPNLCSGTLKIEVDGKVYEFYRILRSGGFVSFSSEGADIVTYGKWSIFEWMLPEELKKLVDEITECVNRNVPQGCCGGCV